MSLLTTLDAFFATRAAISPGDGVVVGFSGGPDSTALLAALSDWSRARHLDLQITAAHLDHALDAGSADRARRAERLAAGLGLRFVGARRPVATLRRRGESIEAAARRLRYDFLERARRDRGSRYVATAHHRDDQAETVVLRLLQGSGTFGLGGIAPRRGAVVRPLLDRSRRELAVWLAPTGLVALDDPTNRDPARPRNRVRRRLLPRLAAGSAELATDLARLAATARAARRAVDRRLEEVLEPRREVPGIALDHERLAALPPALHAAALAFLLRRAGRARPPSSAARRELGRQLARHGGVGLHCGGGWALARGDGRLRLAPEPLPAAPFAYTLTVPGAVELPAGAGALRLSRQAARAWMFEPSSWRAGLALGLNVGDRITIRSRRPGDRIRPFGCSYDRRLKDVLIDRKVPRPVRDRLPLLCVGGRIIWVPGVTIDDRCRLAREDRVWVAQWEKR